MKFFVPLLLIRAVAGAATGRGLTQLEAPAPAPGPASAAPAEAKKEEKPGLKTLHVKFEIKNFNYYDLTKETCPEKVTKKVHKKPPAPKAKKSQRKHTEAQDKQETEKAQDKTEKSEKKGEEKVGPEKRLAAHPLTPDQDNLKIPNTEGAIQDIHDNSEHISDQIEEGLSGFGKGGKTDKPPWMDKEKGKKSESLLQIMTSSNEDIRTCVANQDIGETKSTECTTIMDVLRKTIEQTVQGIITCLYQQSLQQGASAPGPAPMPVLMPVPMPKGLRPKDAKKSDKPEKAAAFLQAKPAKDGAAAPGPAPSGPPPMPDLNIFVTFTPGRKVGAGRSTMVSIAFLDTPNNGRDDVEAAESFLVWCMHSGLFDLVLEDGIEEVTGIHPEVHDLDMSTEEIDQWNINKCEKHIKSIVTEFSHHYTREQVPAALYNECTNFMTKMSFSHDYVLDPMDTHRCRRATAKFAKHWNYGENAKEDDFEEMCFHACEAKYGRNAPTCNIHAGDKLLGQPL